MDVSMVVQEVADAPGMTPDNERVAELKPCPFCGGKATAGGDITYGPKHEAWWPDGSQIEDAYFVNCVKCAVSNIGMCGHQTREKAIAAWNRRAEATDLLTALNAEGMVLVPREPTEAMVAAWEKDALSSTEGKDLTQMARDTWSAILSAVKVGE